MLEIARIQVEREREASRSANRWLVCDTSPLTTLLYCLDEFGRSDPLLDELSQRRYARVLLCAPDFEFVQDGSRRDAAFRLRQDAWYRRELGRRNIEFETIRGSPAERLEQALRVL
jgi:nicotinamide riboside kinase